MAIEAEVAAMRRAIELARTAGVPLGPNPRVGSVLLSPDGTVLAEGYHRGAGSPHAEVDSLRRAGPAARGATVVVSLEPCNHTGRTGPCVTALIEAGVARVVYGQSDPNPLASGGAKALRDAGLDVEGGVLVGEAAASNEVWSFSMANQRPFVTWKFAATVDGRVAAADGSSKWITGPEARADVQRLRALCDAILAGSGTVRADNPRLTLRDADGEPLPRDRQPLRVVMGRSEIDPASTVFDAAAETLVLRTHDPAAALQDLFLRDRQHVWLEGGPTLAAAFLTAGLVDEVIAYLAPTLLGTGANAVGDLGISTISKAMRFEMSSVDRVGSDVRITMRGQR